ncbi:MAG: FHA domain-containing protein, partial [Chloroflexota bacterium]
MKNNNASNDLKLVFLGVDAHASLYPISFDQPIWVGRDIKDGLDLRTYLKRSDVSALSHHQFMIGYQDKGWAIWHDGTNPTWHNGKKLRREHWVCLRNDDKISVPISSSENSDFVIVQMQVMIEGTSLVTARVQDFRWLCPVNYAPLKQTIENLKHQRDTNLAGAWGIGKDYVIQALLSANIQEDMVTYHQLIFCEINLHRLLK